MATTKNYGWIYDKQGNKRAVNPPTTSTGKTVKKPTKIATGKIPDSVGYPGFPSAKFTSKELTSIGERLDELGIK
jgi:hypothetical protein